MSTIIEEKVENKNEKVGAQLSSTSHEWDEEFEAAARRSLQQRMKYAFIKTYKPVLDDAEYRSFETMAEYRNWCEENLPDWLGYGRI